MENVLACRYASQQMVEIWSAESRIILERELWVAVLKAQKELGIEISDQGHVVDDDTHTAVSNVHAVGISIRTAQKCNNLLPST